MAEDRRVLSVSARVPSPCVRQCCLDEADVCLGCLRSLAEILAWGEADDDSRREILATVACRREERMNRHG